MWKRRLLIAGVLGLAVSCGQAPEPQDRYTIVIVEKEAGAESESGTASDREVVGTAFEGVTGGNTDTSPGDSEEEVSESPDGSLPDDETEGPSDPTDDPDGDGDGEWSIVPRDLEAECLVLGEYFHDCGMFSDSVYEQYVQICTSSTVAAGMKAGTIACTAQLTCGDDDLPQCFYDGIEPECDGDLDCGDGVCIEQVCFELVWTEGDGTGTDGPDEPVEACLQVGYGTGTPDVTSEVVVGSACGHGSDCASGRCVWAESDEDPTLDRSWCANKGDCRSPDNDDQACPAGFTCSEVLRYVVEDNPRWLCVPNEIDMCEPLF